jgi:hypothetical protein
MVDLEPTHPIAAKRAMKIKTQLAVEAMEKGRAAMEAGDPELTERLILNAIQYDPAMIEEGYALLARAREMAEKAREAREVEKRKIREEEIESVQEWRRLFMDG